MAIKKKAAGKKAPATKKKIKAPAKPVKKKTSKTTGKPKKTATKAPAKPQKKKKKVIDRPTKNECILAHCHECMGFYSDGKIDCKNPKCKFYVYMPYRNKNSEPDYEWRQYNPKRIGLITFEESKRFNDLTDEQRREIAERLQRAREEKKEIEETEEDSDWDEDEDNLDDW